MDLQFFSPGLTSLHKHWTSAEHQLLAIKYRLQHDEPLVNKSCEVSSKKECEQQKILVAGMTPVHLELTFRFKVAQLLDAETELEQGREVQLLRQLEADEL